MNKEHKCDKCKYEHDSAIDEPCVSCSKSTNHFEPKEHDGCNGCKYEDCGTLEHPCVDCICNFVTSSDKNEEKDYYEPKEKEHSSNCTISDRKFNNKDYGFNEIDMVNHPPHYQHGIEPIDYIESHNLNFNLGNVIKYVSRAQFKGTELQDLKKAKWYLEREIERHEK